MSVLWTPTSMSAELLPRPPSELSIADDRIQVYPSAQRVEADGQAIDLTPMEIRVLGILCNRPNSLVTYSYLSERAWHNGNYHKASSVQKVTVGNIRQQLGAELGNPTTGAIRTHRGFGYYTVSTLHGNDPFGITEHADIRTLGDERVKVDLLNSIVFTDGQRAKNITATEFMLMQLMASNPDEACSIEGLTTALWGNYDNHRHQSLKIHLCKLRGHLGPELGDRNTGVIRTVRGRGYKALSSLK